MFVLYIGLNIQKFVAQNKIYCFKLNSHEMYCEGSAFVSTEERGKSIIPNECSECDM